MPQYIQMERFNELFEHKPKHCIIVCRECQFAVVPQQIARHLKDQHPSIPVPQRRVMIQASQSIEDLAHQKDDVIYPEPDQPPVPGLPTYHNGFRCIYHAECQYVCRTLYRIQDHCKKAHGWENKQKRGGNMRKKSKQAPNRVWKDKQACQRFFRIWSMAEIFSRPDSGGGHPRGGCTYP